jgi:hypothetical protein
MFIEWENISKNVNTGMALKEKILFFRKKGGIWFSD